MKITIFGTGPMPCEPQFAVMAPGSRTWQIVQTAMHAFHNSAEKPQIRVFGLESEREAESPSRIRIPSAKADEPCEIEYRPLKIDSFRTLPESVTAASTNNPESRPDVIIGCASIQPCATAAETAAAMNLPFWADIFGDPFSEIQSKAEIHPEEREANESRYVHVWKLYVRTLLQADRLSALSRRQRFAVVGQLGAAGRLNHGTALQDLVSVIPYGIYPQDDEPHPEPADRPDRFVVMWCGSFNTWMDVQALVSGMKNAFEQNNSIRFLIVGGKIAGYNEKPFEEFQDGVRAAGLERAVRIMDWQPLAEIQRLHSLCDVGLSIDRFTYEACLGSRTRILNFLDAGKPVLSTNVTELTQELAEKGFVLPYSLGDPADLARVLLDAASRKSEMRKIGIRGRGYVRKRFHGVEAGRPLISWLRQPVRAGDLQLSDQLQENPLRKFWQENLKNG